MNKKLLLFYSILLISVTSIFAQTATHLNFDGVNDEVDLGTSLNSILDPINTITVEAWVRPETNTGLGAIIGNYENSVNSMQFLLRRENANYAFWTNDGGGYKRVLAGAVIINTWTHVAGVWDGNEMRIYINGALINTLTGVTGASFIPDSNTTKIGYNQNGEGYAGDIDEVRIWSTTRTLSEINDNKDCELQGNESGLVAYYNFNQGVSGVNNTAITTLIDSSTNTNNGTLSNFTLTGATSNWQAGSVIDTGSNCTVLAIEESTFDTEGFTVYPNPTTGVLNIQLQNNSTATALVYDIMGRKVLSKKINTTDTLNVSNLNSGVYILQITTKNGTISKRIVKR